MHITSLRKAFKITRSKIVEYTQRKKLHCSEDCSISFKNQNEKRGKSPGSARGRSSSRSGAFTKAIQSRLNQACEIFLNHCEKNGCSRSRKGGKKWLKASFVTLTIIDRRCLIDSSYGYYKLLRPFLQWLEYTFGVDTYVWVYEKQMENDQQGHWHIMMTTYVDHAVMRSKWYEILKKNGLVDEWEKDNNYIPKRCLSVEGIKSGAKMRNYFGKYYGKNKQKSVPSTGRWWGACRWIKESEPIVLPYCELSKAMMNNAAECDELDHFSKVIFEKDAFGQIKVGSNGLNIGYTCCEVYSLKGKPAEIYLSEHLSHIYKAYMKAYRDKDAAKTKRLKWQYELGVIRSWDGSFREVTLKNQVICGLLKSDQLRLQSYGREHLPAEKSECTSSIDLSVPGTRESLSKSANGLELRILPAGSLKQRMNSRSELSTFRMKRKMPVGSGGMQIHMLL